MPGCVLRCAGVDFRVDEFLAASTLKPCDVYRRGEPRGLRGKLNEKSGLTVIVSEASGDDLQQQIKDALTFLDQNKAEINRLLHYADVEESSLDFGVWQGSEFAHYCYFPSDLLRLAGELGLGIELSLYVAEEN